MTPPENPPPIGFLTALELAETGFCGGLLLVNDRGRPLEFHCNSPIRPSRAQQILYGATLRSYLFSEAIALSLIEKCSQTPAAILTDLAELWDLSRSSSIPIGWVPPQTGSLEATPASELSRLWISFELGRQTIAVPAGDEGRRAELESAVGRFAERLPLSEPFQRIQLAIEEAQSSARFRESA